MWYNVFIEKENFLLTLQILQIISQKILLNWFEYQLKHSKYWAEMKFLKQISLQLIEDIILMTNIYNFQIKGDEKIAKELQNGNKSNTGINTKDK